MKIKEFINPARVLLKTKEGKGTTLDKYLKKKTEDVYSIYKHNSSSPIEVKTNKVWIDENGKEWPIYRRVIDLTGIMVNMANGYSIPYEIPNIKLVTHQEYHYIYNNQSRNVPLVGNGTILDLAYNIPDKRIDIVGNGEWLATRIFTATIEYTKTTD